MIDGDKWSTLKNTHHDYCKFDSSFRKVDCHGQHRHRSLATPNGNEDEAFHLRQLSQTFATEGVVNEFNGWRCNKSHVMWQAVGRTHQQESASRAKLCPNMRSPKQNEKDSETTWRGPHILPTVTGLRQLT